VFFFVDSVSGASVVGISHLKEKQWLPWYRSTQCSILHDFYIPALNSSRLYDRVAGYFRSTSLAIASQGFSAMIQRGGRIRLVVGADLDPDDVRAVVDQDDRKLLAEELIRQLGQPGEWPEAVENGLGLLSWMVERGHLDIRVALRRHRETGEPLPFASREDGYVHEKWAIFEDEDGNRLLAEGSLNESKTALVLNAENLSVHCDWEGAKEMQRLDEAEQTFEAIWDDQEPGLRVLDLPEAVKKRLIQIAQPITRPKEVDGSSEAPPEAVKPTALEWLQFAILRDAPRMPNGRFVGMATAPVEPWPHQAIVARRLIESWPYSFLLCGEVGLGKTIEAGPALRSLNLSGLARRVLIAPPASLAIQWQNEFRQKFFLRFARALSGTQRAVRSPDTSISIPLSSKDPPSRCSRPTTSSSPQVWYGAKIDRRSFRPTSGIPPWWTRRTMPVAVTQPQAGSCNPSTASFTARRARRCGRDPVPCGWLRPHRCSSIPSRSVTCSASPAGWAPSRTTLHLRRPTTRSRDVFSAANGSSATSSPHAPSPPLSKAP
jgi:hypothetical protein